MNAHLDPSGTTIWTLAVVIAAYYLAAGLFRLVCGYLAVALWRAARPEIGDQEGQPAPLDRCPGEGSWEGDEFQWMEGCDDCRRRTATEGPVTVRPPEIITFECHYRLAP
jgi:hypothetical protein